MEKWLSVVGLGEDGLAGLSPAGRSLFDQAEILVGGRRHLDLVADHRQQIAWATPITETIAQILEYRGRAVCVLASGDPLWYGIATTLLNFVPIAEMTIVPNQSAFSLACSRLGWPLTEVETLSLCGRPLATLGSYLSAGAKIILLSADTQTPAQVAGLLVEQGFGASEMIILEHLGGPQERCLRAIAQDWSDQVVASLHTIAIQCRGGRGYSRLAGLPDSAYRHDGQLTKREIRAITLASLAPQPGQLLWDVGAGCGSIAIEWCRSHPRCLAIAIEQDPDRLGYIAANATALGVPRIKIISGLAPAALAGLTPPDAIFIGGGLTEPGMFAACWAALTPGGRLVANAVTIASEQILLQLQQQWGGELTRIAIQRAEPIGKFLGWKAGSPITQWSVTKTSGSSESI